MNNALRNDSNRAGRRKLRALLEEAPKIKISKAREIVDGNRGLIRRVIRKGHSLRAIAEAVDVAPRTLQKYLSKAGMFFRKPRKNKGRVIRPYKAREIQTEKPVPA
jgi:hypothetical protein